MNFELALDIPQQVAQKSALEFPHANSTEKPDKVD
jgi:hypothetical protein